MEVRKETISGIPALIWGDEYEKVWLCVHGKLSSKESAAQLARIASQKGCQTISFDLPQHGERRGESSPCDIWNGIHDLTIVGNETFRRWKEVSLYACSLGAYFSLHAYQDFPFQKALFQSPIVDMEYLIRQMFVWFGISEERLEREKEMDTPIDRMSWRYYQYVLSHPVSEWKTPTCILYAMKDQLQSREVMADFAQRFACEMTTAENSDHPFMEEKDAAIVQQWMRSHI